MAKSYIVLGSGYGDEGKGHLTNFYASYESNATKMQPNSPENVRKRTKSLVIRFNGGHQAGHRVVRHDGIDHIFASFGSGALDGNPTFWSKYCTVLPQAVEKECAALKRKGLNPKIYIDGLAPVTTFYDFMLNQFKEKARDNGKGRHGSCGVGFGTTIKRNDESPYKFYVQDLLHPTIAKMRLKAIEPYYLNEIYTFAKQHPEIPQKLINEFTVELDFEKATEIFLSKLKDFTSLFDVVNEREFFEEYKFDTYVFEGAQGILLDQRHGIYPHVTLSNTTSLNALEIIERNELPLPEITYVTRCYQTKHGNGWMSNEDKPIKLKNNEKEANIFDEFQGNFRTGILDLDLLNRAIMIDKNYSQGRAMTYNICFTCLDQIENVEAISYTVGGNVKTGNILDVLDDVNGKFKTVLQSNSDKSALITKIVRNFQPVL